MKKEETCTDTSEFAALYGVVLEHNQIFSREIWTARCKVGDSNACAPGDTKEIALRNLAEVIGVNINK